MARRIDTECVHGGEPRRKAHDAITNPLILATAYPFGSTDELHQYFRGELVRNEEYGRYGNPTQAVAEQKIAALESGGNPQVAALLTSGMSAIATLLLAMLRPGMHVVITDDVYRKTRILVRDFLARFGIEHTSCKPSVDAVADSLRPNTKLIVTESPTNPYLHSVDLRALAGLARERNVKRSSARSPPIC
jgi:cystathionine gamma-synthase